MDDRTSTRKKVFSRLYDLGLQGARHPDAITYGANRDCFEHRFILATISPDRAEALRWHRELVDDGILTAPRQTSRRLADGSRRSFQVQRVSVHEAYRAMDEITSTYISPKFVSVICSKCPHNGDDDPAPWDDPEHVALTERRFAELRKQEDERLVRVEEPSTPR